MTNERKSIAQLVNCQHEQSEETEFYPSTQEIVNKAAEWISENGTDVYSVLDIGCRNEKVVRKGTGDGLLLGRQRRHHVIVP